MKKSELKSIIREEIKNAFEKNSPKAKYKKGDKINYLGNQYIVLSDNGYVVTGVDSRGREKTINHNQLSQGMVKEESKEKEYDVYYNYRAGKTGDEEGDDEVTVTASSKEEAIDKTWEKIKNKSIVIKGKAGLRAFEKK